MYDVAIQLLVLVAILKLGIIWEYVRVESITGKTCESRSDIIG